MPEHGPALAEIADDAALLINPLSVEQITDALLRLHREPELREELSRRGRARAAEFTWERSARQTLELYEEVAMKVQSPRSKARGPLLDDGR